MFIQTEQTPNPASLKFLPGCEIAGRGSSIDFLSVDEASASPLAQRLFHVPGVKAIFLGADFVTVTKSETAEWLVLKPLILAALLDHLSQGHPILDEAAIKDIALSPSVISELDDVVIRQIKEILDTRIRPVVAADGGDIAFHAFENGTVFLHMRGACAGCPSSTVTLKAGIENLLKHFIPEVREVRAV